MRMALGMDVGLGSGRTVLDGDPATLGTQLPQPPKAAQQPPLFGPLCPGTVAHPSNC